MPLLARRDHTATVEAGLSAIQEALDPNPTAAHPARPHTLPAHLPVNESEHTGSEQRRCSRQAVMAIRPITLRLVDAPDPGGNPWQLADILNISQGGLCLMVAGLESLAEGHRLELDLRGHPDFATPSLLSQVRWCTSFDLFTTLGIAFLSPLERLPQLELERRAQRRDPMGR